MGRPGVLLDRDGTIIVDHGYVGSVDRVEFIEGSAEAIAAFNRAGIPVAVVSNQSGVARGFFGVEDVDTVHRHIAAHLATVGAHVDAFLFCPYHPDGTVPAFARWSSERKPGAGMALAAAQALDLDLGASCVVGDSPDDMQLAASVGALGIFVGEPSEASTGDWTFPRLEAAADDIVRHLRAEPVAPHAAPTTERRARKFPKERFTHGGTFFHAYVANASGAAKSIDRAKVAQAAEVLLEAYARDAVVFACGNGGSASIANHLQCDHVKGIRTDTGLTPRVVSLASNVELITAIANDLRYEDVFRYQLQSQARAGDVLVAVSSSGRSQNVVDALRWANEHDVRTIALTGFDGGEARELADVAIHVDNRNYGVVEDTHQAVMHALAQYIRQLHMDGDAVAAQTF